MVDTSSGKLSAGRVKASTWNRRIPIFGRWKMGRKLKRQRRGQIRALESWIDGIYEEERSNAKTTQEKYEAYQRATAITRNEQNELEVLLQKELIARAIRRGIEIPEKHWNDEEYPLKRTLLPSGETWTRNELRKFRDSRIEFWVKIFVPVLALILSIVALIVRVGR